MYHIFINDPKCKEYKIRNTEELMIEVLGYPCLEREEEFIL